MTRDELIADIAATRPATGEIAYIERRGAAYTWRRGGLDAGDLAAGAEGGAHPDVWIYYAGQWPSGDDDERRWRAFLDDLLEEMESMAGGMDRCRWPLDEPWPHRH